MDFHKYFYKLSLFSDSLKRIITEAILSSSNPAHADFVNNCNQEHHLSYYKQKPECQGNRSNIFIGNELDITLSG